MEQRTGVALRRGKEHSPVFTKKDGGTSSEIITDRLEFSRHSDASI